MGKKRKWKWVPEVLWRLFGGRAQTFAEAILSLIPENCHCYDRSQIKFDSKSKCLHCCFNAGDYGSARGYLIRPDDPSEYLNLLNRSFVVVSDSAPPLPLRSSPGHRWSQQQIVKRTIETVLSLQPSSSNVICSGYDKAEDSSFIMKLLSSSAWNLVLKRIGDSIMYYLLMHSSIFVPLPRGSHQQVTGPPVNVSFRELSGSQRKRSKLTKVGHSSKFDGPLASSKFVTLDGHKSEDCSGLNRDLQPVSSKYNSTHVSIISSGTSKNDEELNSNEVLRSKKRTRLPSWQRKRLKQSRVQKDNSENASSERSQLEGIFSVESGHDISGHGGGAKELVDNADGSIREKPLQPSCCSVFLISERVPKGAQINRRHMFYNLECSSSLLPKNHILNFVKLGNAGANILMGKIFGLLNANKTQSLLCSHVFRYRSLRKILKGLIFRSRHCSQTKLLEKHCPIPDLSRNSSEVDYFPVECHEIDTALPSKRSRDSHFCYSGSREKVVDPDCFSKCYNSKAQVVSFVWAACRSVIPSELLGAPSCWRILRQNISRFIRLRKFEKFNLKQCMHKLKVSHFPLLSSNNSMRLQNAKLHKGRSRDKVDGLKHHDDTEGDASIIMNNVLEKWIFWLFSHIVVPMVQANFYVTESEHGKQELHYYRKSVWEKVCQNAIHFLKGNGYKTLDRKSVEKILHNRAFGFSKLRFCPKGVGVRALANLRAVSRLFKQEIGQGAKSRAGKARYMYMKSVNSALRDLHSVFKVLRIIEPDNWGTSVFDYNDVYRKLCPFLLDLRAEMKTMPFVYIVVSDVQKAFDTVDQDKLLSIVDEILRKDEYSSQRIHEVVCRKKSLWVHEHLSLTNGDCYEFGESSSSVLSRSSHGIIVNQGQRKTVRKEELYYHLREHVKRNVLQYDKYFFLQEVGIPQGSVLSSLLCSLYYGHLERNVIAPFLKRVGSAEIANPTDDSGKAVEVEVNQGGRLLQPKFALLRFIDDFLFLSTSKKQATGFFSRLQRGFQEYNCHMNRDKFCTNFENGLATGVVSNRLTVGDDGISFIRWSGLLINSSTLEVQADYTRYLNGHLSSSLTVCWQGKPGRHLKEKLCDYMRPKCHPMFYDSNINSASTIRLNIYQSFLLAAMKFHCYVCELSSFCKQKPGFYFKIIENSVRYMFKLVKKRIQRIKLVSNCKPVAKVAKEEVTFLGLTAYIRVLKKKQSRHKELLRHLRFQLASQKGIVRSAPLMYAVDDSHSSFIWKIKY